MRAPVISKSIRFLLSIITVSSISSCSSSNFGNQSGNESLNNFNELDLSNEEKASDKSSDDFRIFGHPSINQERANLNNIFEDLTALIGSYFNDPVAILGPICVNCYNVFHGFRRVKNYFDERFNIPELEGVDQNEIELHGILSLSWCHNDAFILFCSLMKDLISGKKPYRVLFRPLILYGIRTLKELPENQQKRFKYYIQNKTRISFERNLASICAKNGHFDLAFELLQDDPKILSWCFFGLENRTDLLKFFMERPDLAIQYGNSFQLQGIGDHDEHRRYNRACEWIAECILNDLPEEFYIEIIIAKPIILKDLESFLILSFNIPESEYPRIHAQISKLFNVYLLPLIGLIKGIDRADFDFYHFINEISFGSNDSLQIDLTHFNYERLVIIGKVAIFGNKKAVYNQIRALYDPKGPIRSCGLNADMSYKIMEDIVKMNQLNINSLQAKNFKMVFELIASKSITFSNAYDYLEFIMKFYAIKHFKMNRNYVEFEFVALNNLLTLEFPPVIRKKVLNQGNSITQFIGNIFAYMNVSSEETIISFLNDIEQYPNFKRVNYASFGFIETISKLPYLMERFNKAEIKFFMSGSSKEFINFFDLPNYDNIIQLVSRFTLDPYDLIKLKTKKQIRAFEKITGRCVAGYYLDWEYSLIELRQSITESYYYQWRLVFSYWIRSDQKERINHIKSSAILKMLRLEFPEGMKQLNKSEAITA